LWLVIRPEFDEATKYSFLWAQKIIDKLIELKIPYIDLKREQAIKILVEEAIIENYPNIGVIHYDHGSEDAIYGNDAEPVIDLTNNFLLEKLEIFNMNCLSAKKLGVDSYWRYDTIFWGSWEEIAFMTSDLDAFERALNFPILMRLSGETDWNKIMDATLENDNKIIDELTANGKVFSAAILVKDRDARRVWTEKTPPPSQESECAFRKLALKIFGQKGWRIPNPIKPRLAVSFQKA
jgi:hypothetical protein